MPCLLYQGVEKGIVTGDEFIRLLDFQDWQRFMEAVSESTYATATQ